MNNCEECKRILTELHEVAEAHTIRTNQLWDTMLRVYNIIEAYENLSNCIMDGKAVNNLNKIGDNLNEIIVIGDKAETERQKYHDINSKGVIDE